MPELPEVETIKNALLPLAAQRRICRAEFLDAAVCAAPPADRMGPSLTGRRITGAGRRGKFLLLHLDGGARLAVHLRMTGMLLACPPCWREMRYTRAVLHLDGGVQLRFCDQRRFGRMWLLDGNDEDGDPARLRRLGLEPLDGTAADMLCVRLSGRRVPVKTALMDQSVLAGIGNIYSDEILFAAGVRPDRACAELSRSEWDRVAAAIPEILRRAVEQCRTSPEEFLAHEGRKWGNTPFLDVYGRGGQLCRRCGAALEKIRVGGRGSVFCPVCQR